MQPMVLDQAQHSLIITILVNAEFLKLDQQLELLLFAMDVLKVMPWFKLTLLIVYQTHKQEEFAFLYQPTVLLVKQPQLPPQLQLANNVTQVMV